MFVLTVWKCCFSLQVCDHVKNLPEKVLEDIIQVSFDGKRKKLTDLVCRQRFADQWIDDHGNILFHH